MSLVLAVFVLTFILLVLVVRFLLFFFFFLELLIALVLDRSAADITTHRVVAHTALVLVID